MSWAELLRLYVSLDM